MAASGRMAVLPLLLLAVVPGALGAVQCNLGLKLYSVESGKAVCAPFAPYACIESCEWNSTCTKTSHFAAFKGRRTYVTGMVLSDNNFLLQCCASLGTIVQMNAKHEPLCVWTSWVNSVEQMGSLRMDPPLSKNEYIRDIMMERTPASGKVKLRLQICKFLTQRTNCEREKMPVQERHHYSLLLLRLSRTQLMLNSSSQLTKQATQTLEAIEGQQRPASAMFSVVSRRDDKHEVGGLLSGVAGGEASAEEKFVPPRLAPLQQSPPSTPRPTGPVLSPHLNPAFWDQQTGIPKKPAMTSSSAPPQGLPLSSFNFNIVPSHAAATHHHRMHTGRFTPRRIATNATRQPIAPGRRFVKARDDVGVERRFIEETPFKNNIQIQKLPEHPHMGEIGRTPHEFAQSPRSTVPLTATLWKPNAPAVPVLPRPREQASRPSAAIQGLLNCCQSQAPGCRQLCTKDVSKEEIKRALVSQQCPPLSMTSVISCFPQFYDTSPVATCCSRARQLPPQCQALCAPNFKPTLAHLACIEHISTIVECYRDLMQEDH